MKRFLNDMNKIDPEKLAKVLDELSPSEGVDYSEQIDELHEKVDNIQRSLYGSIERLEKKVEKLEKPEKKVVNPRKPKKVEEK